VRILTTVLAIVLLSACGAPPTTGIPAVTVPSPTAPSGPPAGASAAVYFTIATTADPASVAAAAMGRPVYIERAPAGGANPGLPTQPPVRQVFLMPVAPGAESEALARFKASSDVIVASLGRYPPLLPS